MADQDERKPAAHLAKAPRPQAVERREPLRLSVVPQWLTGASIISAIIQTRRSKIPPMTINAMVSKIGQRIFDSAVNFDAFLRSLFSAFGIEGLQSIWAPIG